MEQKAAMPLYARYLKCLEWYAIGKLVGSSDACISASLDDWLIRSFDWEGMGKSYAEWRVTIKGEHTEDSILTECGVF
jgi:hypothetical protein